MKNIVVKTSLKTYKILVGPGLIGKTARLLKTVYPSGKIFLVTQKNLAKLFGNRLKKSLDGTYPVHWHLVPDGETAKSAKELLRMYQAMVRFGMERKSLVLALGGGVVGDLAGFAAATYFRGVRFANVATTLLAQVDSAIGGKTGINLEEGKNLVGAFYQPDLVISDIKALKTLPERELRASLAEVVKYGIIRSASLFYFLEKNTRRILNKDRRALEKIIFESARIKAGIVNRDEFETKGERMILNLGHTFGHGFEQASGYKTLLHGEAVSIGMVCAARLANLLHLFSAAEERRIFKLLESFGLPVRLSGKLKISKILAAMSHDKKKSGSLRFVLPVKIGRVEIRKDVPLHLVQEVIEEMGGC